MSMWENLWEVQLKMSATLTEGWATEMILFYKTGKLLNYQPQKKDKKTCKEK